MKPFRIAVAFLIVGIGGCGSFNNSFNTNTMPAPPHTEPVKPTQALTIEDDDADNKATMGPVIQGVPQQIVVEAAAKPCPVQPWPTPGKPPELPTRALQAAERDVYAIERLERRHIDELRAYISERRRMQREAREEFESKCETVSKS